MKKILILLASTFLLASCLDTVAVIGTGASNGKIVQSSIKSGVSYGIKQETGSSPIEHLLNYNKKSKVQKKQDSCSSFTNKKELDTCIKLKQRIITKHSEIKKKELSNKISTENVLSLQSLINEKSKINYLD